MPVEILEQNIQKEKAFFQSLARVLAGIKQKDGVADTVRRDAYSCAEKRKISGVATWGPIAISISQHLRREPLEDISPEKKADS